MRFGLVIDALDDARPLEDLIDRAGAVEDAGFDLVWLPENAGLPAPMVSAAALAPRLESLRVGVAVAAGVNPVYLAEEAAVADLCLGGRLVLAVGARDAGLLSETVEVLLAAMAARPFRHEGTRWRIPANLPENEVNRQEKVRITPAGAQLETPLWLTGPAAVPVAADWGLSFVAAHSTQATVADWAAVESRLGRVAARLRRIGVLDVDVATDGSVDDEPLVDRLRADQRAWGMDVALLRLPALSPAAHRRALTDLARWVLPRVQLDRLPTGLEQYWKQREDTAR